MNINKEDLINIIHDYLDDNYDTLYIDKQQLRRLSKPTLLQLQELMVKDSTPEYVIRSMSKYLIQCYSDSNLLDTYKSFPLSKLGNETRELLAEAIIEGYDTFMFTAYDGRTNESVMRLLFYLMKNGHQCYKWFDYSKIDKHTAYNYLLALNAGYNDSLELRTFYANFPPSYYSIVDKLLACGLTKGFLKVNSNQYHLFSFILNGCHEFNLDVCNHRRLFECGSHASILVEFYKIVTSNNLPADCQSLNIVIQRELHDKPELLNAFREFYFWNEDRSNHKHQEQYFENELLLPLVELTVNLDLTINVLNGVFRTLRECKNPRTVIGLLIRLIATEDNFDIYFGLNMEVSDLLDILYELNPRLTDSIKTKLEETCKSYKLLNMAR